MVDLKFIDLIGKWQHTSVPFHRLSSDAFEEGFGFDGSSIRGFQPINQSDMLLIPDPSSAVLDPFTRFPTLSLLCNIQDTLTRQSYSRDPRYIAKKAEAYLQSTGLADTCFFGPEAEFFIFDGVRFDVKGNEAFYSSTPARPFGIAGATKVRISATRSAARKAISRSSRRTRTWICAPRFAWRWNASASRSRSATTRWRAPDKARSICASIACSSAPTN